MWEPRRLTNLWYSTACYRDSLVGGDYEDNGTVFLNADFEKGTRNTYNSVTNLMFNCEAGDSPLSILRYNWERHSSI
jgi:hypothetical protein